MALSSVSLKVSFDYTKSPKEFIFEDVTDYSAASGVSESNAVGVIKVVYKPTNTTLYENNDFNNPDIDVDVNKTAGLNLKLPTDSNGKVLQGEYEFTYTVRISGGSISSAYEVEEVKTYDHQYSTPKGKVSLELDCVKPLLKSIDKTEYTVNSVTPSVTREKSNGDDGHIIAYPNSVDDADVTGTTKDVTTDTFYTNSDSSLEHYARLTSQLDYSYGDDIHVIDEITASATKEIFCGNICDVYCCIKSQRNRVDDARNVNQTLFKRESEKLGRMLEYAVLIESGIKCDKGADVEAWTSKLLEIGDCESGCGCTDGEPQLVQGLGVQSSDVAIDDGNGITVVDTTSGGTTTYTISMDATLFNKLSSIRESVVKGGTNASVSKSSSGYTDTYTVDVSIPDTSQPNLLNVLLKLNFSDDANAPVVTVESEKVYGDKFNTPSGISNFGASVNSNPNWESRSNEFRIGDFLDSAEDFYVNIDLVDVTDLNGDSRSTSGYRIVLYDYDSSVPEIKASLTSEDGSQLTGQELDALVTQALVSIKISV